MIFFALEISSLVLLRSPDRSKLFLFGYCKFFPGPVKFSLFSRVTGFSASLFVFFICEEKVLSSGLALAVVLNSFVWVERPLILSINPKLPDNYSADSSVIGIFSASFMSRISSTYCWMESIVISWFWYEAPAGKFWVLGTDCLKSQFCWKKVRVCRLLDKLIFRIEIQDRVLHCEDLSDLAHRTDDNRVYRAKNLAWG